MRAGGTASVRVIERDPDLAAYLDDPGFPAGLDVTAAPPIPVDIAPHIAGVRIALESAIKSLRDLGQLVELEPGASLDVVAAAERASGLQLPNDYRALLTLCNGMTMWHHTFFGTVDYRNETELAISARRYLEISARDGATGIDACVPVANWGGPDDWLLYDPGGHVRGDGPGYVLMLGTTGSPREGLAHALQDLEEIARDVLGTN